MNAANAARAALGAALIAAAASCGSSGSSATPSVRPTGAPSGPVPQPASYASRGALDTALGGLQLAQFFNAFVRPGHASLFAPPVASAGGVPVCDPSTNTQSLITPTVNNQYDTEIFVTYPAGDTTCATSATSVTELSYPLAPLSAGPIPVIGYRITFGSGTGTQAGAAVSEQVIAASVYSAAAGALNVDAEIDTGAADVSTFPSPANGTVPAVFPPPNPLPVGANFAFAPVGLTYIAVNQTSLSTADASIVLAPSSAGNIAVASSQSWHVQTAGTGSALTFAESAAASPVTVIALPSQGSTTGQGTPVIPVANAPPRFTPPQLGAGSLGWVLGAPQASGSSSTFANFALPLTITGTLGAPGSPLVLDQTVTDATDGIAARIASDGAGGYTASVTDLLRAAPATTPATLALGPANVTPVPFTFVFDQTVSQVQAFEVLQ